MKHIKSAAFVAAMILVEFLLLGCEAAKQVSAPQPPPVVVTQPPPAKPQQPPQAGPSKPADPGGAPSEPVGGVPADSIRAIVEGSACARYSWKDHGRAFFGYVHGVALSYGRAVCAKTVPRLLGDHRDALVHYGVTGGDLLLKTYALMVGLGMRESDGRHCVGRDTTNPDSSTGESCEGGAWQESWDIRYYVKANNTCCEPLDLYIVDLFKDARGWNSKKCLLEEYREGMKEKFKNNGYGGDCSPANYENVGSGDGKEFQRVLKSCPAFAAALTAHGLRVDKYHWGPIKRREAELRPECELMLAEVKALVENHPQECP